jgi:very-short-patch-repair endonuclease
VLKYRSRKLRSSATDAERRLWYRIRRRQLGGFRFRRQHPIGNYIVDFVCPDRRLIVEIDGGQHAEQCNYDEKRSRYLSASGFRVLRFWNNELMNDLESVLELIWKELHRPSEPPP